MTDVLYGKNVLTVRMQLDQNRKLVGPLGNVIISIKFLQPYIAHTIVTTATEEALGLVSLAQENLQLQLHLPQKLMPLLLVTE